MDATGLRDVDVEQLAPLAHVPPLGQAGSSAAVVVVYSRGYNDVVPVNRRTTPASVRVGYIHDWKSNWFNERHFADYLAEDVAIRRHIIGKLSHAGLSKI